MDGYVTIGTMVDTKEFDSTMTYIESRMLEIEHQLKEADMGFEVGDTQKLEAEYEKLGNQLIDLKKKQEKYNQAMREASLTGLSNIQNQLSSIGDKIGHITKKVVGWGLALFGVRSAYYGIRKIVSVVSAENEGISSQIDVMRSAIANALLPVVQTVLNAIAKIMVYINYIYKMITGKNLFDFDKAFSSVSEKAKSTADSLGGATKSAKELRKTLAGFDEMNILNDNVTSAGGGAGGGGVGDIDIPEIKNPFENWKDFKIPKWVEKIGKLIKIAADNWRDFAGVITLVGVALGVLTGNVGLAVVSFILFLITQLPTLIDAIKILSGSNTMLEVGLKYLIAIFNPGLAAIISMVDAYDRLTTSTGSTAMASINLRKAQDELKKSQRELSTVTSQYKNALDNAKVAEQELKQAQDETGLSGEELYKQVQNGTLSYLNMNEQQKKVYEAYLQNKEAQDNLKDATEKLTNAEKNQQKATKDVERATLEDALAKKRASGDYEGYKKTVVDAYEKGEISAGEARDYIEQACQDMSDANKKTFTKDIPKDVKDGLNPDKYQTSFNKFKNAWNNFMSGLKTRLSLFVDASGVKSVGGNGRFAKGGIVYHRLPKLASGGILNQPGRGVPVANALVGERGMEGVIPLTDSQQMALLGEAIGKYITINASIINTMNGRVISRELKKVQDDSDFAYNR